MLIGPSSTVESLEQLAREGRWGPALAQALAVEDPPAPPSLVAALAQHRFVAADVASLTAPDVDALFPLFPADEHEWTIQAALSVAANPNSARAATRAVEHGLRAVERWTTALPLVADALAEHDYAQVDDIVRQGGSAQKAALARRTLVDLQDRILTWEALYADGAQIPTEPPTPVVPQGPQGDDAPDEGEDGWGELDLPPEDEEPLPVRDDVQSKEPLEADADADTSARPSLATFLTTPLVDTALALAAAAALPELTLFCTLHPPVLWPARVALLDAIPEWVDPTSFLDLLPAVDSSIAEERDWDDLAPWRTEPDWSEALPSLAPPVPSCSSSLEVPPAHRTAEQVRAWYLARIERCADLGLVDVALALVQHGAARGVSGLDETGEELSLLAKLVYERPGAATDGDDVPTLARWHALSPPEVLRAYTSTSAALDLPGTLRRLVLPYLSVLESRLERAGTPDPASHVRTLLHEFLVALPLERPGTSGLDALAAVVAASKPTLPQAERIVTGDEDLARVVLAALYGAGGRVNSDEGAAACGRMFECLPAFDAPLAREEPPGADLFALAAPAGGTLAPSAPPPAAPAPSALLAALARSGPRALSSHLDALDLHLSQLELLVRYASAPPSGLAWFLAAYGSAHAQRLWAVRLARTAATGGARGREREFEGEDEWVSLMEFMREATGVAGEGEGEGEGEGARRERGLGRMFCCLGEDEVLRIFFGGLLAAGRFSLARALFEPSSIKPPLEPQVVEELVIAASREFYDNAEEGNLHSGEMKLAFECLAAAPQQTPAIRRERDFIEATSRLCSFRLDSRPGIPLTPIELRHAPDRLSYVARLLSSNEDAHRHPEMVLALVHGLGYPAGGAQEVRALAMLADAAIDAGSYPLAAEQCARAVRAVEALRRGAARGTTPQVDADTAADHAWRACFALGKSDWADSAARLEALGQALTLCPPERIQDLLPTWTVLEREVAQDALRRQRDEAGGSVSSKGGGPSGDAAGLSGETARAAAAAAAAGAAKVSHFLAAAAAKTGPSPEARPDTPTSPTHAGAQGVQHLASETAAAASYTLRRAAAFLQGPGSGSGAGRPPSSQGSPGRATASGRDRSASPAVAAVTRPARSPSPPSRFASALAGLGEAPPRPAASTAVHTAGTGGGGGDGGMFGFRAGLGEKFTAGVGWLIGADELLEREKEEQEYRRQSAPKQGPEPEVVRQEEKKAEDDDGDDWDSW